MLNMIRKGNSPFLEKKLSIETLRNGTGWFLALLSMVLILFMGEIPGLPAEGQRCLALFAAVFFLYLFESISAAVVSLAIVPLLVVMNIVPIKPALSGFSSTSTYLIVGSFIIAEAMIKSRLGNRITYFIFKKVGITARRISLSIVLVNIVMAFMVPSSTARTAMLLPICLNIIKEFNGGIREKTKFGTNLLLTLCCTNSTISAGILTATITNPMAVEYIREATGHVVSFSQWFKLGFPPALLMTFFVWGLIQLIFKSETKELPGGLSFVEKQLDEIGSVSTMEKKALGVFILTILLWVFGDRFGIDSTTACLLGASLLFFPFINVLTWDDVKHSISLSVVFICSGGISLGAAMSSTGAASWVAESLFSGLHLVQYSSTVIIIALIVIVQFLHLAFAGTATMANVFFPIVLGIANVSGIDPIMTILPTAFMIGGYPLLMFFNTTPNILCYDTGEVQAVDFPKIGVITSIVASLTYALCLLFYWNW